MMSKQELLKAAKQNYTTLQKQLKTRLKTLQVSVLFAVVRHEFYFTSFLVLRGIVFSQNAFQFFITTELVRSALKNFYVGSCLCLFTIAVYFSSAKHREIREGEEEEEQFN